MYHVNLCNDESLEQQILIKNFFVKVTFSFDNLKPTTNTPDRPGAPRHMLKFLILFLLLHLCYNNQPHISSSIYEKAQSFLEQATLFTAANHKKSDQN